jgi:hypothetical protein
MKWTVKLIAEVVERKQIEHAIATVERTDGISPATVGLTIAEGKAILKRETGFDTSRPSASN